METAKKQKKKKKRLAGFCYSNSQFGEWICLCQHVPLYPISLSKYWMLWASFGFAKLDQKWPLFLEAFWKETDVYKVCVTCCVCLVNWPNKTVCRCQYTMSPCITLKFTQKLSVPVGKTWTAFLNITRFGRRGFTEGLIDWCGLSGLMPLLIISNQGELLLIFGADTYTWLKKLNLREKRDRLTSYRM